MEESKLENVLGFYYETIKLKEVERSGWNTWNVSRDKRVESIPEHVYGTQQLAFAIYSEFDIDIDIFKVNSMLAYHETEEINIGDLNPFSGVSTTKKAELGSEAVEKTVANMKKKSFITSLIDEFNERKTPEAQFAYLCDKMEADLMAKKYQDEGRFSFDKVSSRILNDKRLQSIMSKGAITVADVFIEYDVPKYSQSPIFSELIQFLKDYKQTK